MITRILIDKEGKYFYQLDGKDVSTHFGMIRSDAIQAAADGATVLSNTNQAFTVITPTWLDVYRRLKRGPQIMMLKDLGIVSAETGIGPDSIIGEAGTGSGAAACYFARIAKRVYSYDVIPEHVAIGQANSDLFGYTNTSFRVHDVYESIPAPDEGQYDLFLLDNPEPWRALPHASVVKIGGWIVGYLPSINQTAEFVNQVLTNPSFQHRKTIEVIERDWAIKGLKVRPSSAALGHTGFLVFIRRIK